MTKITFWAVTTLAGIYVLVAIAQAYMYSSLDKTMAEQREMQAKLTRVEPINNFTQQLIRRMIVDSANDPNLAQILKMNGVKINYPSTDTPASAGANVETPGAPVSPVQN